MSISGNPLRWFPASSAIDTSSKQDVAVRPISIFYESPANPIGQYRTARGDHNTSDDTLVHF